MAQYLDAILLRLWFVFAFSMLGFLLLSPAQNIAAQYPPAAGQAGTTAIPADSSIFVAWANYCTLTRGWLNIADTTLGKVSVGLATAAINNADNGVVSLGDGGTATLLFPQPIRNGSGFDFAVFENGFASPLGDFLELAYVEVSSDGVNFIRFPSSSLTPPEPQINSFGTIDPKQIHNLAGKYYTLYGTPFDLEELADSPLLDVEHITHVRIVDVVGSIADEWVNYDSDNNPINDPYPTAFPSGGFDLDAVGVIHQNDVLSTMTTPHNITNLPSKTWQYRITAYPNPATDFLYVNLNKPLENTSNEPQKEWAYSIKNALGVEVQKQVFLPMQTFRLDLTTLPQGVYYLTILGTPTPILANLVFLKN